MTADPRAALALLVSALERHLEVASTRRDPDDPAVISAAEALAEAFDTYDETLFAATEVATPLAVYGDLDDDEDDDYDDELDDVDPRSQVDAESAVYAGLDDEDVDFDEDDEDDEDDDEDEDEDDPRG